MSVDASRDTVPAVAISACLTGKNCTYRCGNHLLSRLDDLQKRCRLVPVCPETQGGLMSPRPPAERRGNRVVLKTGDDVTQQFERGARRALDDALSAQCVCALLKEKSPSCGFGRIYDGTFTGVLVEGNGVAAQMLADAGLPVFGEGRIADVLAFLDQHKTQGQ